MNKVTRASGGAGRQKLSDSPMMAHLLNAMQEGKDIGHYGRLVFCMVAHHFMEDDEVVQLLAAQPDQDESKARAMLTQVKARDYSPPRREQILEWQAQQEFPICPNADDPGACNLYGELRFPPDVYERIQEFYEEKADAQAAA